jgi:hypothetical protein
MRHKNRVHVTTSTKKKISQTVNENLHSSTLLGEDDYLDNENDTTPEYCQDILSSTTNNQQQESIRYQTFQMNINGLIKPSINHTNNTVSSGLENGMLIGWTHGIINENNKGFPLVEDVMSVFEHVKTFQLSNSQGNGTLQLLKDFVLRHPIRDEVFLHRDMRSINNVFGKVVSKLYRATHIDIPS